MKRLALLAVMTLAACGPGRGPKAAPIARLPEFTMTAVGPEADRPFGLGDLKGKVWVAQFVFTRCSGPCPLMTQRLKALGGKLPPEVALLSVSVDPAGDTPERLRRFAGQHGLDFGRWVLLRGSIEDTYQLLFAGFRLPMSTNPKAPAESRVTHSTRFVLLDREGAVRGYYDAFSEAENSALARDARALSEVGS